MGEKFARRPKPMNWRGFASSKRANLSLFTWGEWGEKFASSWKVHTFAAAALDESHGHFGILEESAGLG